ncbi:MAG: hypothetical protein ACJAT4_003355 [Granulosicoccus sp.]|jgi:hypothetical protein
MKKEGYLKQKTRKGQLIDRNITYIKFYAHKISYFVSIKLISPKASPLTRSNRLLLRI